MLSALRGYLVFPPSKRLLANSLGYSLKALTFLCKDLGENSETYYTLIRIPKGNGKFRKVYRVDSRLKLVHSRIKSLLEERLPATGSSYAYEPGCTVAAGASRMDSHKLLVSVDFKDHFSSVTMWQVTKTLEAAGAKPEVAFMLARLSCITRGKRSFLPQGSEISPLLSNRVSEHLLDPVLEQAFPAATITRYSDNLYFGFDTNLVSGVNVISKVREIVRMETGWRCHKCRIMPYYRRQRGLGLVLNQGANMPREKYLALKALLHNLAHKDPEKELVRAREEFGFEELSVGELLISLAGQVSYWRQFLSPTKHNKLTQLLQKAKERNDGKNNSNGS